MSWISNLAETVSEDLASLAMAAASIEDFGDIDDLVNAVAIVADDVKYATERIADALEETAIREHYPAAMHQVAAIQGYAAATADDEGLSGFSVVHRHR